MVKVREDYIADAGDENAIEQWLTKITAITNFNDIETVRRACLMSMDIKTKAVEEDRVWAQEHNSFKIGLEMAQILVELELDQSAIIAAILSRQFVKASAQK
jgi:GTP pyrophosphokinase